MSHNSGKTGGGGSPSSPTYPQSSGSGSSSPDKVGLKESGRKAGKIGEDDDDDDDDNTPINYDLPKLRRGVDGEDGESDDDDDDYDLPEGRRYEEMVDYETTPLEVAALADDQHHRETSVALHEKIKQELRSCGYDPFAYRHEPDPAAPTCTDPLLRTSTLCVSEDMARRALINGPSITKEKFTAPYWDTWRTRKNLLEDMSYDEVRKEEQEKQIAEQKRTQRLRALGPSDEEYKRSLQQGEQLVQSIKTAATISAGDQNAKLTRTSTTTSISQTRAKTQSFDDTVQQQEQQQQQFLSSNVKKGKGLDVLSRVAIALATAKPLTSTAPLQLRKGAGFAPPPSRPHEPYFDHHLLKQRSSSSRHCVRGTGSTGTGGGGGGDDVSDGTVAHLMSRSLGQRVPLHPVEREAAAVSTIATKTTQRRRKPDDAAVRQNNKITAGVAAGAGADTATVGASSPKPFFKGGAMDIGKQRPPSTQEIAATLTKNCDLPPLPGSISPGKGPVFPLAMRFKTTREKPRTASSSTSTSSPHPGAGAGAGDTIRNSGECRVDERLPVPTVKFTKAPRFSKDVSGSVKLRLPVRTVASAAAGAAGPQENGEEDGEIIYRGGGEGGGGGDGDKNDDLGNDIAGSGKLYCMDCTASGLSTPADASRINVSHISANQAALLQPINGGGTDPTDYVEYEYFPNDAPGPGKYHIKRLFDEDINAHKDDFQTIYERHKEPPRGLYRLEGYAMARVGTFGFGCNRQEHVLYGMCKDGKCCTRANYEKTILRKNDLRRLSGYDVVSKIGRNTDGLVDEMTYSQAMLELLPEAPYKVDPLYSAAYAGDVRIIKQLAKNNADPNVRHPESRYSALHAAVFRAHYSSVVTLLNCFRGRIQLDIQDKKGDTPLHLAAREGLDKIAGAICDEEHCDPLSKKNYYARYPIDEAKSHKVFQMIKLCQDRNELLLELQSLKTVQQQSQQPQKHKRQQLYATS